MDQLELFDPTEPCGSVHPNHPDLKCIRMGGPCITDDHVGLRYDGFFAELVVWGKSAEQNWKNHRPGTIVRIIDEPEV